MSNNLSKLAACKHCGNLSKMEIIGSATENDNFVDEEHNHTYHAGITYSVLKCPACKKINIVTFGWDENTTSDDDITYEFLYPLDLSIPIGLPEKILRAYQAAQKVKSIDVNAYAILVRRLLELICLDRKAEGKTLASMLNDLSSKGEIPSKLVKVAEGLKNFGNIGAHAGSGELTEKEIPIVNALCSAILEYVYSAPHLATLAEQKLKNIKGGALK